MRRAAQAHKDEIKYCCFCSDLMIRKRMSNGLLESNFHFKRRKYCGRDCMVGAFILKPRNNFNNVRLSRQQASNLMKYLGKDKKCNKCLREKNVDIHHLDGNPFNNMLSNLQSLCRSCHVKEHRPKRSCIICGDRHKGRGYCDKHLQRYRKYGDPLFKKYK